MSDKYNLVESASLKKYTDGYSLMQAEMAEHIASQLSQFTAEAVESLFGADCSLDEIEAPNRHPNDAMSMANPIDVHQYPGSVPGQFKAMLPKDETRPADNTNNAFQMSRRPRTIGPSLVWTSDLAVDVAGARANDLAPYYPLMTSASNIAAAQQLAPSPAYEAALREAATIDLQAVIAARRELALAENLDASQLEVLHALNDFISNAVTVDEKFDPDGKSEKDLWDEYARRANAHGSGSRHDVMKQIEDFLFDKHGADSVRKMKLYSNLKGVSKRFGSERVNDMANHVATGRI